MLRLAIIASFFVIASQRAWTADPSLLDLSHVNSPGQMGISLGSVTTRSGLSTAASSSTISGQETQTLTMYSVTIGLLDGFAIGFSGGNGSITNNFDLSFLGFHATTQIKSKGDIDSSAQLTWRIFGSGGDDDSGLLIGLTYSPDQSGDNATSGTPLIQGNLKRGGAMSAARLGWYKKFDHYDVMLRGAAYSKGESKKKLADNSATYKTDPVVDSTIEFIQRWNIAEVFFFDLVVGNDSFGKVLTKNLGTASTSTTSSYNQNFLGLGFGFNFGNSLLVSGEYKMGKIPIDITVNNNGVDEAWFVGSGSSYGLTLSYFF